MNVAASIHPVIIHRPFTASFPTARIRQPVWQRAAGRQGKPLPVSPRRVLLPSMNPLRLTLPLLLLLAGIAAGGLPRPVARPVRVHNLATLTPTDALRLAGTTALYRVEVDSRPEEHEGRILVDCVSPDRVHRTARLLPQRPGETSVPEAMTVRAQLRVIRHPASWGFPELVEYRLLDAVEVKRDQDIGPTLSVVRAGGACRAGRPV